MAPTGWPARQLAKLGMVNLSPIDARHRLAVRVTETLQRVQHPGRQPGEMPDESIAAD